jgi:hypothetical protein
MCVMGSFFNETKPDKQNSLRVSGFVVNNGGHESF